ncbi:hypothetical protein NM22_19065, partial [Vibrio tubiashii]
DSNGKAKAAGYIDDSGNGAGNDADDDRPTITDITEPTVDEGQAAVFDVTLSNVSELATPITMSLTDGNAESGSDYNGTTVSVTYLEYDAQSDSMVSVSRPVTVDNGEFHFELPAGNTSFSVSVTTLNESGQPVYEGDETFTLTAATEAQVEANASQSGSATIQD